MSCGELSRHHLRSRHCWTSAARRHRSIRFARSPSSTRFRLAPRSTRSARIVGERMRVSLGQPVIIENMTGAAGTLAVGRVARALPDGYTISIGNFSSHVLTGAIYRVQYDALKDLQPIALLASNPQLIISKNALPASDLKGLIAWLKCQSGQGLGRHRRSRQRVARDRRILPERNRHALPVRALSWRQPGAAGLDRRDNSICCSTRRPAPSRACAQARSRPMPSRPRRGLSSAPDIPTVAEAGVPGLHMSIWSALWAPKGTPPGRHCEAQCRRRRRDGRSDGARSTERPWARYSSARATDA